MGDLSGFSVDFSCKLLVIAYLEQQKALLARFFMCEMHGCEDFIFDNFFVGIYKPIAINLVGETLQINVQE